jgi:hypothetical protein
LFVGYVFDYFVCCGFVLKWFVVGLGEWEIGDQQHQQQHYFYYYDYYYEVGPSFWEDEIRSLGWEGGREGGSDMQTMDISKI